MRYALTLIILFFGCRAFSQSAPPAETDISKIKLTQFLTQAETVFVSPDSAAEKYISQFHFHKGMFSKKIPAKDVPKTIYTRFSISNNSDSATSIVFFPGFFFENTVLFREEDDHLAELPEILPPGDDSTGYRVITLAAHDSATLVAKIHCVKTYNSVLRPRLINPGFLASYIVALHHQQDELDLVTYVFSGLLIMMMLFSLATYFQGRNREFLYYSGYAFFLAAMFFTKTYYNFHASAANNFFEAYLDFIMQSVATGFYMVFMQKYLATKKRYPFINKLYDFGIAMLAVSVILYSYLHFFTNNFVLENLIETLTKVVLLLMIVVFIIYSTKKWDDKLLRFLVWGNLFLFIFSLMSQAIISFGWRFKGFPPIMNQSLVYYEFGLFIELVFFLMGLSYKNRKQIIEQTRERERLKMEKQMAVITAQQEERNRISTDMHDELGSGMTHIRLMSELAKNKMKETTPVEIEKISQSADDVLNKMNAIIWSMNSKNDSLGNLISYIRAYSLEYLEATTVLCKVNIPAHIPEKELSGDKRRNIFLCVKETLNNMLKHSKASEVLIDITVDEVLAIKIFDNGVGIDFQRTREFGNGLQNIDRRMRSIGGSFSIKNKEGTLSKLELPL